jgi:hypothetical protein
MSAGFDSAAHRVAASEGRQQYWRTLNSSGNRGEAVGLLYATYTKAYEREAGQPFPEGVAYPSIWDDEGTGAGR